MAYDDILTVNSILALRNRRTRAEFHPHRGRIEPDARCGQSSNPRIEKIVGAPLFERQARGLSLTDAGAEYLPFVREALEPLRLDRRLFNPAATNNGYDVAELRQ